MLQYKKLEGALKYIQADIYYAQRNYKQAFQTVQEAARLSGRVREVLSELDKMKKVNDEELYALEEIVNSFKDDAMKKLREDFHRFKDEDFKLMRYWYAGFSPAAMYVLMKIDEISDRYKRKSQLFF